MKMIGLCSDHAGFELKEEVTKLFDAQNIPYKDFGAYSSDSCDYPDFAHPLALAVEKGEMYPGIAFCGTGNGIGMALNKHQGIRAALCWHEKIAALSRAHNDANILVLPARFITKEEAMTIIAVFLETPFEGGRHQRRINKIPL